MNWVNYHFNAGLLYKIGINALSLLTVKNRVVDSHVFCAFISFHILLTRVKSSIFRRDIRNLERTAGEQTQFVMCSLI